VSNGRLASKWASNQGGQRRLGLATMTGPKLFDFAAEPKHENRVLSRPLFPAEG
jgi:hypothetical protein